MTTENPPAAPPAAPLTKTFIPADMHDRGYVKDWLDKPWTPETAAEVFKKLDNAEKLVGKKSGIPEPTAPETEWDAFHAKFRPEKLDEYEVKSSDAEFAAATRKAFHEAGLTKRQAARLQEHFTGAIKAKQDAILAAQAESDKAFEALVKSAFGPENEKVLGRVNAALKELTPDVLKPHLDKLTNENLAIVAGVVNNILVKYGLEDRIGNNQDGTPGAGGETYEALEAEGQKLIGHPAYRDFQHPEHKTIRAKAAALFEKLGKMTKGG